MTDSGSRVEAENGVPNGIRPTELLASAQRLTGIGVWAYDGDADETG